MFRWLPKRTQWNAIFVEAAIAWLFFFADPLGLAQQKTRILDNYFAYATQYLRMAPPEKVAVVLIDGDWLKERKLDWPAPYDAIVDLVNQMDCARVKAIFLDFVLTRQNLPPEAEARLRAAVENGPELRSCADNAPPVDAPFFFGKLEKIKTDLNDFLAQRKRLFLLNVDEAEGVYRTGKEEFPVHPVAPEDATPAFGLMSRLAMDVSNAPCAAADNRPKCWTAPLSLIWSAAIDPRQGEVSDLTQCRGERDWLGFLADLPWPWPNATRFEPCPPVLTLRASQFDRSLADVEEHGDFLAPLAGRVVFVGADLPGLNDRVASPIHDHLPGVYRHAVAFGELLAYGRQYPTLPPPLALALIVAAIYLTLETVRESLRESAWGHWGVAAVFAFGFAAIGFVVYLMNWPASLPVAIFLDYAAVVVALFAARRAPARAARLRRRQP